MLAFHCAPLLSGVKASNMMNIRKQETEIHQEIQWFHRYFYAKGFRVHILCECDQKALLFFYHEGRLKLKLSQKPYRKVLDRYGYRNQNLKQMLGLLGGRIQESNDFPHEIGLFLDYPIADVTGFIRYRGGQYKFAGYWKVYSNPNRARRLFEQYTLCRERFCEELQRGKSMVQIMDMIPCNT